MAKRKKKKAAQPKKAAGPNKSAAIRAYAKAHPKAGPTEISRELKKKGIRVAVSLVSNVKKAASGKKAKSRRKPGRPAKKGRKAGRPVASATVNDNVSLSALLQARDFAEKVGGLDKAVAILQALKKLS